MSAAIGSGASPAVWPRRAGTYLAKILQRKSLWLLLALVASGAALVFLRARGPAVAVAVARTRPIEQHVVASGRVLAPARINVASSVGGLVLTVAVAEGQHVKRGDLLVQIDDAEACAQVV